jgi:hypothetical protein
MATVVLSAVGAIVGGPIGAAVGAVIGQQVDNVIFAPGRRQGPRLGDLTVQTSSYGSMIPKLFGTVRMSGIVIWATDLKESRTTRSNGKGRGSTDVYSYSASFAVALSGRRISDIGRIWADGKLLRGAAGDFKSETGFRFYVGDEGQGLDPLIAASEGISATPAYRGIAYVVFEDMQLAAFGNRIPSISFEVIADAGGTSAGAVLSGLGAIASDGGPLLTRKHSRRRCRFRRSSRRVCSRRGLARGRCGRLPGRIAGRRRARRRWRCQRIGWLRRRSRRL